MRPKAEAALLVLTVLLTGFLAFVLGLRCAPMSRSIITADPYARDAR